MYLYIISIQLCISKLNKRVTCGPHYYSFKYMPLKIMCLSEISIMKTLWYVKHNLHEINPIMYSI